MLLTRSSRISPLGSLSTFYKQLASSHAPSSPVSKQDEDNKSNDNKTSNFSATAPSFSPPKVWGRVIVEICSSPLPTDANAPDFQYTTLVKRLVQMERACTFFRAQDGQDVSMVLFCSPSYDTVELGQAPVFFSIMKELFASNIGNKECLCSEF